MPKILRFLKIQALQSQFNLCNKHPQLHFICALFLTTPHIAVPSLPFIAIPNPFNLPCAKKSRHSPLCCPTNYPSLPPITLPPFHSCSHGSPKTYKDKENCRPNPYIGVVDWSFLSREKVFVLFWSRARDYICYYVGLSVCR